MPGGDFGAVAAGVDDAARDGPARDELERELAGAPRDVDDARAGAEGLQPERAD